MSNREGRAGPLFHELLRRNRSSEFLLANLPAKY